MTQKMEAKHVYDLDDLKTFRKSGASILSVCKAFTMMAENNKRREKATVELFNLDWEKVSLDRVKDLVEQGADVKQESCWCLLEGCWWPLYVASMLGHLDVVKYLVAHGADVNAKNQFGNTLLHKASEYGYLDGMKCLVELGADVEAKNGGGNTPLHKASEYGHLDVVKYLVAYGADVKAKDNYGRTPLHRAREEGHAEVVAYFVEQRDVPQRRSEKAKEIRFVDADRACQPVDHSLRRMLFGGKQLRQNAPLSPVVAERFKKRQDRS